MARDPQVDLVFSHMTPRYLATGVDPNDLQRLVARIERWDDWCRIWCAEAARHEDLAQEAAERNRNVTASESSLRASIYYHYAKHLFAHDPDQYLAAHQRMLTCYQRGCRGCPPSGGADNDSVRARDDGRQSAPAGGSTPAAGRD